ncbi:MAG: hypothetical protein WDZ79_02635 [Candidatus Paceibacterota bacterium]
MNQNGVTLIELILYVALVSVIIGVTGTVFFGMYATYTRDRQAQFIEAEGSAALTRIRQAIRSAEGVSNIEPGASDSALELVMSDSATDPTVIERDGTTLTISQGGGSPVALTSSLVEVTALAFRNLAAGDEHDTIQISFTLKVPERADTTGEVYEREFVGSAHLRSNYE